jgi:hypothetical protein
MSAHQTNTEENDVNDLDRLRDAGVFEWMSAADARVATVDEGTCRHCGKPLVFKPYFLDGKQPNPPIWWHPHSNCTTCSTRPADWPKSSSWPTAEPTEARS